MSSKDSICYSPIAPVSIVFLIFMCLPQVINTYKESQKKQAGINVVEIKAYCRNYFALTAEWLIAWSNYLFARTSDEMHAWEIEVFFLHIILERPLLILILI